MKNQKITHGKTPISKIGLWVYIFYVLSLTSVEPQSWNDLYEGIHDLRVLPMLKDLSYDHGGIDIKPKEGRLFYDLILKNGYKKGLEIGTSNGYSSLWIGLALKQNNGHLITIEIDHQKAREAQKYFRQAGLAHIIDLRMNDAFEELSKLENDFDFIFIDGWKKDRIKFYKMLKYRLKRGGAIAARNQERHAWSFDDLYYTAKKDSGFKTTTDNNGNSGILISIKKL